MFVHRYRQFSRNTPNRVKSSYLFTEEVNYSRCRVYDLCNQQQQQSLFLIFLFYLSLSATYHSTVSPGSIRRLPPPLLRPPPPPVGSVDFSVLPEALPVPRTSISTPPSPAATRCSLIQSTSFLESIPVTLTMEPKDWINTGLEDEAGGVIVPDSGLKRPGVERTRPLRGFDVELKRKPGEGFGFVIASQDVENGRGESQYVIHSIVQHVHC